MTLNTFQHWYRYHHQGRPITIVKRYSPTQGIISIPVLATGSPREGFLEPFTITSIPTPNGGNPSGGGIGEIKSDNFFKGTEGIDIYIYCGMTLEQAIRYIDEPPATPLHQGVRGRIYTMPTTWSSASKWLAEEGIKYEKEHKACLNPSTIIIGDGSKRMKGVIHNYYKLTIEAKDIKEDKLVNVPHLYDEEHHTYIVLIKTYGYIKKSNNIIRLLNKALISRDKSSCIDYATAFLERPVYDIDMSKIDWSKPVQGIDIVQACIVKTQTQPLQAEEDNDGKDMGVSLPASYDF